MNTWGIAVYGALTFACLALALAFENDGRHWDAFQCALLCLMGLIFTLYGIFS